MSVAKALKGMMYGFDRFTALIDWVVQRFMMLCMAVVALGVITQLSLRFIIRMPVLEISEINLFTLAFLAFVGGSHAIRTDQHVRFTMLRDMVPAKLRRFLNLLLHLGGMTYCYVLVRYGYMLAVQGIGKKSYSGAFSLYFVRFSLVIGGALMLLQIINHFIRDFAGLIDETVAAELEKETKEAIE